MPSYIKFVEVNMRDGRKTRVWAVLTIDGRSNLGTVSWYAHWRKYAFQPEGRSVFEEICLRDIAHFCERSTAEYKQRKMSGAA